MVHTFKTLRMLFLSMFLFFALVASAVPARRGVWRTITLTSGESVCVEARGDEHLHYWQSADGRRFLLEETTGLYVETDEATLNARSAARRQVGSQLQRSKAARRAATRATTTLPGSTGTYLGKKKGLVILVEFSNKQFSLSSPQAFYNRVCNEEGFSERNFQGSVADYFKAQSGGLFELNFDVVGPVKLAQSYSYYGRNDDANAPIMIHDACVAVDDQVNFADYDWDGDGEAEEVFVVYAGYGESDNTDQPNLIWPHMYWLSAHTQYTNNPLKLDGTLIDTYACANELTADDLVDGIGTFCHEFSHCLGFPDMYDTGEEGTAFGMGSWSLMDYGCYNGDGYVPCGYTAYEKMCAGWMEPLELHNDTTITDLAPTGSGGQGYLLRHPDNTNELLVIENRQLTGYDAFLPGHGMLVSQITYDEDAWYYNEVNSSSNDYERWTIYHADNSDSFYDQEGDPYPRSRRDSLTASSKPALAFHNPMANGRMFMPYGLLGIKENSDGTMQFTLRVTEFDGSAPVVPGGVLFKETFDQCQSSGGNDGVFKGSVASGPFNPDVTGWKFTNGGYGGDQCARFGRSSGSGSTSVTSPAITLTGDTATLSFRAAGWESNADGTTLLVELKGGNAKFVSADSKTEALQMTRGKWTDYSLEIVGTGTVNIVFTPSRRFFLDDVLVTVPVVDAITTITTMTPSQSRRIYSLDGRYVGDSLDALPRGIYVVGGKKYVK